MPTEYRVIPKKKLGDYATCVSGSTPRRGEKSYWCSPDIPWVKTGEVSFSAISETEEYISHKALKESSVTLLPPKTVLIAMYGQGKTRGQSAILEVEATTNQACFAILPNTTWEPEYLFLWLRYSYHDLRALSEDRGGNQSNLNGGILKALEVPAPPRPEQLEIVKKLDALTNETRKAYQALSCQLVEVINLANAIIFDSIKAHQTTKLPLSEALLEVKKGIGESWQDYPVLGATRTGLSPAKEPPGKYPHRYKPVTRETVFYNPMRIMIGSIAYVDINDKEGITSPDYVVLKGIENKVHSRWFYYWLRSPLGEECIQSLSRGAVRERMLFNRLKEGMIELPDFTIQSKAADALAEIIPMQKELEQQLADLGALQPKILSKAFEF